MAFCIKRQQKWAALAQYNYYIDGQASAEILSLSYFSGVVTNPTLYCLYHTMYLTGSFRHLLSTLHDGGVYIEDTEIDYT